MPLRITADVARRLLDRVLQRRINLRPCLVEVGLGNTDWLALAQSVPPRGVAADCTIAVAPDITHDAADCRLDFPQIGGAALCERSHKAGLLRAFENAHHITTLFSGYSTMP